MSGDGAPYGLTNNTICVTEPRKRWTCATLESSQQEHCGTHQASCCNVVRNKDEWKGVEVSPISFEGFIEAP